VQVDGFELPRNAHSKFFFEVGQDYERSAPDETLVLVNGEADLEVFHASKMPNFTPEMDLYILPGIRPSQLLFLQIQSNLNAFERTKAPKPVR
jgi:hypothetical protein